MLYSRAVEQSAQPGPPADRTLGFELRSSLGRFPTGVCVVSVDAPHGVHGVTVSSFLAVSLEPPLVLVSLARTSRAHDLLPGRPFCVNVLGAEQEELARRFAGMGDEAETVWDESGIAPRLPGALAHLGCAPWQVYDGGDHSLVLGEVREFDCRDGDALGFFNGRFLRIDAPVRGIEFLY